MHNKHSKVVNVVNIAALVDEKEEETWFLVKCNISNSNLASHFLTELHRKSFMIKAFFLGAGSCLLMFFVVFSQEDTYSQIIKSWGLFSENSK